MAGIAQDDHAPKNRQIDREGRPISAAQDLQRDSAIGQRRDTLKGAWDRGPGATALQSPTPRDQSWSSHVPTRTYAHIGHGPAMLVGQDVESMH